MKSIVLVGAGALGSHVLLFLRNVKATIKVIDFDLVEQKNVLAQMHTTMSLRRNKAQALQQALRGMFGTIIEAVPHKLTTLNTRQLLGDVDLVLDCTDNIAARDLIQGYVTEHGIPCLHGCLSAGGDFARIVWTEHFESDQEDVGAVTCEDGEQLPFFGMAAAQTAVIVQQFLKDGRKISCQIGPTGFVRLA